MLAYNQAIAELENHLHEDGYLSQPIGQSLVFKSEPNATVSISNGTVYSEKQLDSLVRSWGFGPGDWGYAYFEQLNKGLPGTPQHLVSGDLRTVFELGKTTTVTYTNLQNSTMNGKKIAKSYSSILLKIQHDYRVKFLYLLNRTLQQQFGIRLSLGILLLVLMFSFSTRTINRWLWMVHC